MRIEKKKDMQIRRAIMQLEKKHTINKDTIGVEGFSSREIKGIKLDTKLFTITISYSLSQTYRAGACVVYSVFDKIEKTHYTATHYFPNQFFDNTFGWYIREGRE